MGSLQKRLIFIVIAVLLALGIWSGLSALLGRDKTAHLTIEIAPLSSSLKINGSSTKAGIKKLKPGSYTVEVTKNGFASYKKSVTLQKGSDEYIGAALAPNTAATEDWYDKHPDDQKMAEKISSRNFDKSSSEAAEAPIASKLPFIGPGSFYRIDYAGVGADGKTELVITTTDEDSRADALDWISNQGFDVKSYSITYQTFDDDSNLGD